MIRSTLLALVAATPVLAQSDGDTASGLVGEAGLARLVSASDLEGTAVYAIPSDPAPDWEAEGLYSGVSDGWTDVGTVVDVAMSRDGATTGIVVALRSTMDGAAETAILDLADVKFVDAEAGRYAVATRLTSAEIEDLGAFGSES